MWYLKSGGSCSHGQHIDTFDSTYCPWVQVTFKGQGPLGELQAIATSEGTVKGKVQAPKVDPPLNAAGKLNVSSAIGKGFLAVVRNHHLMAQPYTGE